MEWLKIAFDTMVVGALALPWLWLFMRIFFQPLQPGNKEKEIQFPILNALSDATKQAVAGVMVVALGYFLGSAVSRISSDFFDDDDILIGLPNETSIRHGVYLHEYCDEHGVLMATRLPEEMAHETAALCLEKDAKVLEQLAAELFSLQESKLLLVGEEKLGRLREFHDQIVILRGAALNGLVLGALSCFGLCALYRSRLPAGKQRNLLVCMSYAPAAAFILLGTVEVFQHSGRQVELVHALAGLKAVSNPYEGHLDPPLAEALLILLGIGGLFMRLKEDSPRLFRNLCMMATVLTLIAYGSWWWTEVLYDQQVIHSVPTTTQSNAGYGAPYE